MKSTTTWLASAFDWIGEVFEHLSPAMFRMLAAVLPYLSPLPAAYLTAQSATEFLGFPKQISVVLVLVVEGIGLWVTTETVDSVVEFIRSRNIKTGLLVGMFLVVIIFYIGLLISLNVNLEKAVGNSTPLYSWILTLICFLPLISGVMNGYRKVKMESKTEIEKQKEKEAELAEKRYQDARLDRKEKWDKKHGYFNPNPAAHTLNQDTSQVRSTKEKHASDYREKAIQFILEYYSKNNRYPDPKHLTERFNLEHSKNKGYMSTLIKNVSNGVRQ